MEAECQSCSEIFPVDKLWVTRNKDIWCDPCRQNKKGSPAVERYPLSWREAVIFLKYIDGDVSLEVLEAVEDFQEVLKEAIRRMAGHEKIRESDS